MSEAKRMAIVDADGVVQNVVLLADGAQWAPPQGTALIQDDGKAAIGGKHENGAFSPPPPAAPSSPEELSLEEQIKDLRDRLAELEKG